LLISLQLRLLLLDWKLQRFYWKMRVPKRVYTAKLWFLQLRILWLS